MANFNMPVCDLLVFECWSAAISYAALRSGGAPKRWDCSIGAAFFRLSWGLLEVAVQTIVLLRRSVFACAFRVPLIHARYDWTTGGAGPHRAGQWKWMVEVPRRTSLALFASPCFILPLKGMETERLVDYQGKAGIISIVRWKPLPGHIWCRTMRRRCSCFQIGHLNLGWNTHANAKSIYCQE